MAEFDSKLPASGDSRSARIERIVDALSEHEREELRLKLQIQHLQDYAAPLKDIRTCVATGINWAVCVGFPIGLIASFTPAALIGARHGLVAQIGAFGAFSVLIALAFGLAQVVAFKVFYRTRVIHSMINHLSYEKELTLPLSQADVFKITGSILLAQPCLRVENVDGPRGTIGAVSRADWKNWLSPGIVISVKVDAAGENSSRVQILGKNTFSYLTKMQKHVCSISEQIEDAARVQAILNEY